MTCHLAQAIVPKLISLMLMVHSREVALSTAEAHSKDAKQRITVFVPTLLPYGLRHVSGR